MDHLEMSNGIFSTTVVIVTLSSYTVLESAMAFHHTINNGYVAMNQ
jgi:hypothetical protein